MWLNLIAAHEVVTFSPRLWLMSSSTLSPLQTHSYTAHINFQLRTQGNLRERWRKSRERHCPRLSGWCGLEDTHSGLIKLNRDLLGTGIISSKVCDRWLTLDSHIHTGIISQLNTHTHTPCFELLVVIAYSYSSGYRWCFSNFWWSLSWMSRPSCALRYAHTNIQNLSNNLSIQGYRTDSCLRVCVTIWHQS